MKRTIILFAGALLIAAFGVRPTYAQLTSSLIPQKHDLSFSLGREFWFAEQSNYWGVNLGGKYIHLYISSAKKTTAYIEAHGVLDSLRIVPDTTSTYIVSDSLEMELSGIVENKGIHIWSNDADLTVYSISHNPYTSDGSYVIPTIGWSTDYVVGAYGSLFEGGGCTPLIFLPPWSSWRRRIIPHSRSRHPAIAGNARAGMKTAMPIQRSLFILRDKRKHSN